MKRRISQRAIATVVAIVAARSFESLIGADDSAIADVLRELLVLWIGWWWAVLEGPRNEPNRRSWIAGNGLRGFGRMRMMTYGTLWTMVSLQCAWVMAEFGPYYVPLFSVETEFGGLGWTLTVIDDSRLTRVLAVLLAGPALVAAGRWMGRRLGGDVTEVAGMGYSFVAWSVGCAMAMVLNRLVGVGMMGGHEKPIELVAIAGVSFAYVLLGHQSGRRDARMVKQWRQAGQ